MHVVVALHSLVEPACLVGERQFLDQAMFGEQVQRAVNRAVGDRGIPPTHPLEDLAGGQVPIVRTRLRPK